MMFRLLLTVFTALSLSACFGGGPADTVEDFYRHVEQGELDDAAELMSKSVVSQVGIDKLKQGLQQATRQVDAKGGIREIEVVEEKVIGEIAEVTVKITYGNGDEVTEKSSLIEEDGRWRLQSSGTK